VVIGGGIAGTSAAHELAERGFEVVVLERRDQPGGKARSIDVAPPPSSDGAQRAVPRDSSLPWVPGEHGFRFFPGFYRHVVDSMGRIPTDGGGCVADALVSTTRVGITQYARPMVELPALFPRSQGDVVTALRDLLLALSPVTGLQADDLAHFGGRMWQILTSCAERRIAEYEGIPWWEFVGADERPAAYQKFLASGITRSLVAAKARTASTRTMGDIFLQLMLTIVDPLAGSTDRVLDGPTSHVWIDPWRRWIESLGVDYRTGVEVTRIRCEQGRITGVEATRQGTSELVRGDHYVCAVPIERAAPLMNAQILAADPSLASLEPLACSTEWMNGVQFYLRRDVPMLHGHVIHIDSEWALTSISQFQFWRPAMIDVYQDVEVNGVLSVDVSDWEAPGLTGRTAVECSPDEVVAEVWEQLKRSVNRDRDVLEDGNLCGWFLDPDIGPDPARAGRLQNLEPLLVNRVRTWPQRPEAITGIPNLFLASDYVRTHTDLATMEAANEAARRAVNGILDAEGVAGSRCEVWPLREPAALEPWRAYDLARFRLGMPWDATTLDLAAAALSVGAPALGAVPHLTARVAPLLPAEADVAGEEAEDGPAGFVERLGWYREQTMEALRHALPDKEPGRHLYDLIREFVAQPSKGLRPALCLATCRAYGGSGAAALPSAAGLELLHNAFLVHDDIEDGSLSRRGRTTLHRRAGTPLAVNAGDAMNALSMRLFRRNLALLGPEAAAGIAEEVDHLLLETLEGQAMELGWIRDHDCRIGTDDYLRMVLKKTAWYSFIHPLRIGALAAGAGEGLERFHRLGFLLGAAFQIQDDVLNLTGSASRYGKEIGGDLCEGKRTLVLVHALAHAAPSARSRLEGFLSQPGGRRLERDLAAVRDLLERSGSVAWARRSAAALTAAAQRELPVAFRGAREGPDLDFVRALVGYVTERDL
jgi:geranylgeranyl pyrophosphate synthase/uncharacterized protein with NAD-binding domain and iron-sulfur cluster